MMKLIATQCFPKQSPTWHRMFSMAEARHSRVAVIGASGGIGQPLSLLLKMNPLVTELSLHDIKTPGVGMDLSHINTHCSVEAYIGDVAEMKKALNCAQVVVVPAGMPRKPGMERSDLFDANALVILQLCELVCETCPKALIAIITNPINTLIPLAAELLKKKGCYDPKRLFGVTALDMVRASTFVAQTLKVDPKGVTVPVIAGHSPNTIVPLLSQSKPEYKGDDAAAKAMVKRIQNAGTEVVKAKAGGGSATLSMAYAGARFTNSLLRGLKGESNVVDCAYIEACHCEGVQFFSCPFTLGKDGIKDIPPLPPMNDFETEIINIAVDTLKKDIKTGVEYAKSGGKKNKDSSKK